MPWEESRTWSHDVVAVKVRSLKDQVFAGKAFKSAGVVKPPGSATIEKYVAAPVGLSWRTQAFNWYCLPGTMPRITRPRSAVAPLTLRYCTWYPQLPV